jgi:hypothetical protein
MEGKLFGYRIHAAVCKFVCVHLKRNKGQGKNIVERMQTHKLGITKGIPGFIMLRDY